MSNMNFIEYDGEVVGFKNKLLENSNQMAKILIPAISSVEFKIIIENFKNKNDLCNVKKLNISRQAPKFFVYEL